MGIKKICSFTGCDRLSPGIEGCCKWCGEYLCLLHWKTPFHPCASNSWSDKIDTITTRSEIELAQLIEIAQGIDLKGHAESLRPQQKATIECSSSAAAAMRGGYNIHLPVNFDDGIAWLARIRNHRPDGLPAHLREVSLQSELHTMRALSELGAKVPDTFSPLEKRKSRSQQNTALEYFFVKRILGQKCHAPLLFDGPAIMQTIEDYARFQIALSAGTFSSIGSLCPGDRMDGKTVVGPIVHERYFTGQPPFFLGPYRGNKERFLALLDYILGEIEDYSFFGSQRTAACVFHLEIRTLIETSRRLETDDAESVFYIKHGDDKGDQIFVDENGHITGIVDWEWAYTTTKAQAFAAPLGLVEISAIYSTSNALSPGEVMLAETYEKLNRADLAQCVRDGKVYQRLEITIGKDPDLDLLKGLQGAFGAEVTTAGTIEEWYSLAQDKYRDHPVLKRVLST